ncbi:MAG: zinc ABC transporter substrate-binding protein [Proteobacteria bacterium]|nr:zinc ABC transporter substrate-binding protein [Pseudomonadota bacterium]MDA1293390.1 zinc ABC transporter substrate-binding protein [Pseudomonadota bacterium]
MTQIKRVLFTALVWVGISANGSFADEIPLRILASFSILGDMVKVIVGDFAEVDTIVGPDADAHVYQPNISDAREVALADIIFVNGLGFETWSETLIAESGTKASLHVATKGINPLLVSGNIDPHAWNSLSNGVIYANNIANVLKVALPEHADAIEQNRKNYVDQLLTLDTATRKALSDLPENRRVVVTAHDAFGYLANAYDLTFLAPVGIDTEAEPSAKDLAILIKQIKTNGAAALFVENITSPVLIEQLSAETGLRIGGRLFSDALSVRGGPATSYLKMFEHNLNTLLSALQPTE